MNGKAEAAFCVVRPPGHHAKVNGTSGFCLLNNVAIGARYAQSIYGIHKILIFDFDGHHGDGTQSIFYEDATVFYVSVHQQDIFPYTGSRSECGKGAGHGFTRNYPLPSGAGDDALMHIVDGDIAQIITTFRPELTFLSSGFDGHIEDPLTGLQFTTEVFAEIADHIRVSLEKAECTKIVSVLEGGYSPRSLSSSAVMHVSGLLGRPYPKIDRLANRSRERE
jgi:acetoin utilization deacetylase AcuC-like enzyme